MVTNGHHASEPDVIGLHNFINENFQKNSNPNLKFNLFIAAHEHNNQVLIDSVHSYQIIVGNCSSKKPAHVNKKQNTVNMLPNTKNLLPNTVNMKQNTKNLLPNTVHLLPTAVNIKQNNVCKYVAKHCKYKTKH